MNETNILRLENLLTKISSKVRIQDEYPTPLKNIMAVDVAYCGEKALTVSVLFSWPELQQLQIFHRIDTVKFPYISSMLSFREGTIIIRLLRTLLMKPDILMVNAHGIAHPLQCGCASYIGVLTDTPTIGVAKTKICGETIECEGEKDIAYLKFNNKIIGAVLNPDEKSRRIIVSPGHRISLKTAVQITLKTLGKSRLPIILEEAHRKAAKLSDKLLR